MVFLNCFVTFLMRKAHSCFVTRVKPQAFPLRLGLAWSPAVVTECCAFPNSKRIRP